LKKSLAYRICREGRVRESGVVERREGVEGVDWFRGGIETREGRERGRDRDRGGVERGEG
jgi:hypothetical protein